MSSRQRYRQSGFTLLELMIIIGIIGVLASVTSSDFSTWRRYQELKELTREAYHTLVVARAEAVRGQQGVTVTFDSSGLWAFIDSNGNKSYDKNSDIEIYQGKLGNQTNFRQYMRLTIDPEPAWIYFNSKGYSVDENGAPRPAVITCTDEHPTVASTRGLTVGVSYPGALRIGE